MDEKTKMDVERMTEMEKAGEKGRESGRGQTKEGHSFSVARGRAREEAGPLSSHHSTGGAAWDLGVGAAPAFGAARPITKRKRGGMFAPLEIMRHPRERHEKKKKRDFLVNRQI